MAASPASGRLDIRQFDITDNDNVQCVDGILAAGLPTGQPSRISCGPVMSACFRGCKATQHHGTRMSSGWYVKESRAVDSDAGGSNHQLHAQVLTTRPHDGGYPLIAGWTARVAASIACTITGVLLLVATWCLPCWHQHAKRCVGASRASRPSTLASRQCQASGCCHTQPVRSKQSCALTFVAFSLILYVFAATGPVTGTGVQCTPVSTMFANYDLPGSPMASASVADCANKCAAEPACTMFVFSTTGCASQTASLNTTTLPASQCSLKYGTVTAATPTLATDNCTCLGIASRKQRVFAVRCSFAAVQSPKSIPCDACSHSHSPSTGDSTSPCGHRHQHWDSRRPHVTLHLKLRPADTCCASTWASWQRGILPGKRIHHSWWCE